MGSVGNPTQWAPYDNYRDCSQGICSIYCPQWCYIIFPPPPPLTLGDDSTTDFSPLIIAVIGILASAFILVTYYTIVSKFCSRSGSQNYIIDLNENRNETGGDSWQGGSSAGLDEALIKSITVCKYKKGDGLVDGTDCSVCLSEFEENESLRLLPKCNHAFHVTCIDTWLTSHSSCPLCRANIAPANTISGPNHHPPAEETIHRGVAVSALQYQRRNDSVLVIQDLEMGVCEDTAVAPTAGFVPSRERPKTPNQAPGSVVNVEEVEENGIQPIRRSVSLNSSLCQDRVSIADILRASEDTDNEESKIEIQKVVSAGTGSSKQSADEELLSVNNMVMKRMPVAMKRSFSTGRFMFTRYDRGRNSILPE